MSNTVNYSFLNNNEYQNKPFFISGLDLISAPIRRVLGGRSVSFLKGSCGKPSSLIERISLVFIAYVCPFIAFCSALGLALKLTMSMAWEKRAVVKESARYENLKQQFSAYFSEAKYGDAYQFIKENPILLTCQSTPQFLISLIRSKISNSENLSDLSEAIALLPEDCYKNAISLINEAIKHQLRSNERISISKDHILSFIWCALHRVPPSIIKECLETVITDALLIDVTQADAPLKIDISDYLIDEYLSLLPDPSLIVSQNLEIRAKAFKKTEDWIPYHLLFLNHKEMQKIHARMEIVKEIADCGYITLNNLEVILKDRCKSFVDKWDLISRCCLEFRKNIAQLTSLNADYIYDSINEIAALTSTINLHFKSDGTTTSTRGNINFYIKKHLELKRTCPIQSPIVDKDPSKVLLNNIRIQEASAFTSSSWRIFEFLSAETTLLSLGITD